MASAINASTTDGLQIISDTSSDFEFQRNGVKVAGFTSTGLENAGLQNSTISINGTSVALGGTADLEQDCMHAQITNTGSNPTSVAAYATIPLTTKTNVGTLSNSSGTITIGRDGVYFIMITFLAYSANTGYSNTGDGRIRLNGVDIAAFYSGAKDWNTWEKSTSTAIFPAVTGDTITIVPVALSQWHRLIHSEVSIRRTGD
jgi:hypothetical protein